MTDVNCKTINGAGNKNYLNFENLRYQIVYRQKRIDKKFYKVLS